ncbi:voltage-dependent calcium channel unc-36 [Plakobranchus ocellatus]|uniref:Voltage-dependent calcium channel unc-36 n=1 Tax=Plakobranchus ocellatus TaxID=259542 RepID=A0AAV4C2F3_9GAST|nr:voltage-dependent calcium channel unc-36 [Plakobranchus ocellatus]
MDIQTASPEQLVRLVQEKELYLRKSPVFYDHKRAARQAAQTDNTAAAVAFDFAKNLNCPNISSNDACYRRQLSLHTFIVHSLPDDKVHLFTYDETVGKKDADEVCSILYFYFTQVLSEGILSLELFCDSCPGQNKNWTMIRFLHYMVMHQKRFQRISISFPIRGHSYMECDHDMAVINQKARVETPDGWLREFESTRKSPSPFNVVAVQQDMFLQITNHIKILYKATPQFPIRPMREILFTRAHPRIIQHRANWNGPFESSVLSKPLGRRGAACTQNIQRGVRTTYTPKEPTDNGLPFKSGFTFSPFQDCLLRVALTSVRSRTIHDYQLSILQQFGDLSIKAFGLQQKLKRYHSQAPYNHYLSATHR